MLRGLEPSTAASGPRVGHVFDALNFDGTTFTVDAHHSCGHRGLGGIAPFVAPTSGPLTLPPSPSIAPACISHVAATTQLYIFAIPLKKHGAAGGGPHWNGVEVAGPVNAGDNPWVFAPLAPGLTMIGGGRYDFVVATAFQHPTPAPSSSPKNVL
jgi:hypothetical protein